jgi:hypothetical protein
VHPVLRAAADRQWGIFTASDARRAGYGHAEIRDLCGTGRWVRLRRGVYVTAKRLAVIEKGGARHRADCLAVLLDLGRAEAALSHSSTARLWGMPVPRGLEPVVRLTDPHLSRRGQGFHLAQAPLPPADVETREALRLTTPSRTLVDCAREWPLEDAVIAMDAALLAERTTLPDLQRAAEAAKGWRGAAGALRAVGLADGRAESALETRGRLKIIGAGLPTMELQVEIRVAGRLIAVVDGRRTPVPPTARRLAAGPCTGAVARARPGAGAVGGEAARGRRASARHPVHPHGRRRRRARMAADGGAAAGSARPARSGEARVHGHPSRARPAARKLTIEPRSAVAGLAVDREVGDGFARSARRPP